MARTWLSVTVELLGGRGQELWPWPGRVLAVGPSHTFRDLADAINAAFARWDRSHLSLFTLADGRVVTDEETGAELASGIGGPILSPLDIASANVAKTVEPGAEFRFTFDLGDEWVHRCVVEGEKVDPVEVLGIRPPVPVPSWGWGTLPDQYGRRWADDDGTGRPPRRPPRPHPMLTRAWPDQHQAPALDVRELRVAIARQDPSAFLAAVTGREIDDVLQQVAAGLPLALALDECRDEAELVTLSVINRLTERDWVGDVALAEDLLAHLRHEPLPGRVVPVDLDMLSTGLEGDPSMSSGGYVDLRSGDVYDTDATDEAVVGEDSAIDVEEDPERWLGFDCIGSHAGWDDMAAFAARQRDEALRTRLERAIEGKGAFRRFRDLVHDEGLAEQWNAFSDDRRLGRARDFLAGHGVRVG